MTLNRAAIAVCVLAAAGGTLPTSLHAAPGVRPATMSPNDPITPLQSAIERAVAESESPARTRGTLMLRMGAWPTCYRDDLTEKEWLEIFERTGLLAPADGSGGLNPRYYLEPNAWLGQASIQASGNAARAMLTYSFPDDGTIWGLSQSGFATGPNSLNSSLVSVFGDLDRGREIVRQAIASWRAWVGVEYTEVADNNSAMDQLTTRQAARGDIRIGGVALTTGAGILAYNAYPLGSGTGSLSGGDMVINTSYFLPAYLASVGNDYRYLRNTVAHEHGHGLGLRHVVPCDLTKLMEPQVGGAIGGLQHDDIRGGQRNYGDFYSGNQSSATPAVLGELSLPGPRSLLLRNLSTNGSGGPNGTAEDWFVFTLGSARSVTITVTPIGSTYTTAPQTSGCSGGSTAEINSLEAGNLLLQLRGPVQTLIAESTAAPAGQAETINLGSLAAGTYFIRVRDHGNNQQTNQIVQMYDLLVRIAGAPTAPRAIAGLNKRVQADSTAWFMGHINSRATEPGATLNAGSYEWDFDNDGLFDKSGSPTTYTYVSNGSYTARLRVTDSNGVSSTDSIGVTVWGATTTVESVSPSIAAPGTTVPVVITGTNLKGVTSASQVTVSGTGVTVTGTPTPNYLGTQITGLSFVVAPGAQLTTRNVSVTNSDGQGSVGSGIGVFIVGTPTGACCVGTSCAVTTQAQCGGTWLSGVACGQHGNPTTCCPANFDGANGVDVPDIFAFLSAWFAGLPSANFDGVGGIAVADIFAFLSAWFAGCP
ncbi:MAG: PKD domain-containing protein [Phycisphaeraceae bacterium]|nr:PKD domain-containing protein [Phycisphaeraceae bacterium]